MDKRKTKIIATIGPASDSHKKIRQLIVAGANVLRLNFSHGTHEYFYDLITRIRDEQAEMNTNVAILADLQGPKIRTGKLKDSKPVYLHKDSHVEVTNREVIGDSAHFTIRCATLLKDFTAGDKILINDGRIQLKVVKHLGDRLMAAVLQPGELTEHKGVNFPDQPMTLPSLTKKDIKDLDFALRAGVDMVALSFVRSANDIVKLKKRIARAGYNVPVIAKIEKPQALADIDNILAESDGIMVARGDLGVEIACEKVPIVQKQLIHLANINRTIVITATQMLESMITSNIPTRAEVSDVANAVFDGTDAVMLSGETAAGSYPLESIAEMEKIAIEAENSQFMQLSRNDFDDLDDTDTAAIAHAAVDAAIEGKMQAIVVFTLTGKAAMEISKRKPPMPIIAFTPERKIFNFMSLFRGVTPIMTQFCKDTDEMLDMASKIIRQNKLLKKGDKIVIVAGVSGVRGSSNMLKIHLI